MMMMPLHLPAKVDDDDEVEDDDDDATSASC
jgi:hypothetical protein